MAVESKQDVNYILTFGYGNRTNYDAFLEYIKEFKVTCIIDVRLSPRAWSRKWYGSQLEKVCNANDIKYISMPSLGNTSGTNKWTPPDVEEADRALLEVSNIAKLGTVLLLCGEMDSRRCHRVDVANQLHKLTH